MRVLLFTGKGGVGKTTTAAATAVHAARRGIKTLVLSTDVAHSLGDALGRGLGPEPAEVEPALFAQQVEPRTRVDRAWRDVQDYLVRLLEGVGVDPVTAEELSLLPGADEVLALLEVRDQVTHGPWDLVVVDCAPSAETLRLLAIPEALGWHLDRMLSPERRVARVLRPVVGRAAQVPVPQDRVLEALARLRDELAEVRRLLTEPTTSVRLVLTPEAVVLAEARRTLTVLALHGYRMDCVVANRLVPAGDDPWRSAWATAQAAVMEEAQVSFAPAPVLRAPYQPDEPVGTDALAALAQELYDNQPDGARRDALEVTSTPAPLVIERSGSEFVLELHLPLAARGDVDLARRGDDLLVSVGTARRILTLPSALRRCIVVGARLRDGALRIRFEPDPALWRPL